MIGKCKCGKLKTVPPYGSAGEKEIVCESCSEGERNRRRDERDARKAEQAGLRNRT